MRVGDLVKTVRNHIGVVIDTAVEWNGEGTVMGHNGSELEVICK